MKRENFFTVMTRYDAVGRRSRFVRKVHGRTLVVNGYKFGAYFDETARLFRIIDLDTGKQVNQDTDMQHAISRLYIKPAFDKFVEITNTENYKGLCREYKKLIAKWEAENKCV